MSIALVGAAPSLIDALVAAEVVEPRDTQFVPGTTDLSLMLIGKCELSPSVAYSFPVFSPQVLVADVDGGWVPSADAAARDFFASNPAWSDFSTGAALACDVSTRVQLFVSGVTGQPDDEPDRDDGVPELLLIGTFPPGTKVRAFVGGSPDSPIRGPVEAEITAAVLERAQLNMPIPSSSGGASRASCIGLDGSGDLGLPAGQTIAGYEVTLPAGAPVSLKVIPISPLGNPDSALAGSLGIDGDSLSMLKGAGAFGRNLIQNGDGSDTSLPLPSAVVESYTDAPGITETGGQASPNYTFITNPEPPPSGEEYPADPDDPTGGEPNDPTDPGDPDDPDGPGDPGDPDDPDGDPDDPDGDPSDPLREPGNNGVLVLRPDREDPLAESEPDSTAEEAPTVPAPGAIFVMGIGGALLKRGRRRR